jgi:hypothetical protein
MNFYWRQTIVGLLRVAAERIPEIELRCLEVSEQLDRTLSSPYLDEAFALFQDATLYSRDPVYVTGAYYTMRALEEVTRWEAQAGGPVRLDSTSPLSGYRLPEAAPGPAAGERAGPGEYEHPDEAEQVSQEVDRDVVELFERIRAGATLDEALALFPHVGDEHSPD